MAVASGLAGPVLAGPVFTIVLFLFFFSLNIKKDDIIVAISKEKVRLIFFCFLNFIYNSSSGNRTPGSRPLSIW